MALAAKMQLSQMAIQIATDVLQRAKSLEPERRKIEARLKEIQAISDAAHLCDQRIAKFQPEIGGNLQCPGCWILREAESALTPISSDAQDDFFRCNACDQRIKIEMGL